MASSRPPKRLVIFCDGTWVGRETTVEDAPPSNIRQLANMVGEVEYSEDPAQQAAGVHRIIPHTVQSTEPDIVAGYQEGCGLNKTFLEYIWDGATASDIGGECIAVYKFIVENFTDEHEIWLFGFSRGAFTVRCVTGMINNCGIIKRLPEYSEEQLDTLCTEVFRTYRSPLPSDAPKSKACRHWKGDTGKVWQVKRPIRFMGLIDTVGALGIPRVSAGVGFDWSPFEFFDQHVSSAVHHVYHAPALHERLWIFQPCLIYPDEDKPQSENKATVHQQWFPGCHYDVGRMTFRFIRQAPSNKLEEVLGWLPDQLSRTIYPNEVLSDAVLKYLVEGIRDTDNSSPNPIIPNITKEVDRLTERITSPGPKNTGSGDIYSDIINYAPAGIIWGSLKRVSHYAVSALNQISPRLGENIRGLLGVETIIGILSATADRRIPAVAGNIYPYKEEQQVLVNGRQRVFNVAELGYMTGENEWGNERYQSKTFESFLLWNKVFGNSACDHVE